MTEKDLIEKQKINEMIQGFTLMDDDFMTSFFEDNKECTQFILRTILDKDDLVVIENITQRYIKNLEGRSVKLDVFARDSTGKPYDIEIQRATKGAGARRARYNLTLMDAGETLPGMDTEELPESYVIFITEKDFFGKGKALYKIDRYIDGEVQFNDGTHIIYVNGAYKGNDKLGDLIHDFKCEKASDMKNKLLAERVKYLKETEKGVKEMNQYWEEFREQFEDELREEAFEKFRKEITEEMKEQIRKKVIAEVILEVIEETKDKTKFETAAKLLANGDMTEARIKEFFNFSDSQMKSVKKQITVLA